MKKSVYISGIACAVIMLLGCMFKIMHWPGASMLFIIPVALFCLYFLPIALIASYREEKKYKALHIVTFIVFLISMTGVLFKVIHWPGASILLFVGLPLPFILFLPVYLKSTSPDKKESNPEGKKSSI